LIDYTAIDLRTDSTTSAAVWRIPNQGRQPGLPPDCWFLIIFGVRQFPDDNTAGSKQVIHVRSRKSQCSIRAAGHMFSIICQQHEEQIATVIAW